MGHRSTCTRFSALQILLLGQFGVGPPRGEAVVRRVAPISTKGAVVTPLFLRIVAPAKEVAAQDRPSFVGRPSVIASIAVTVQFRVACFCQSQPTWRKGSVPISAGCSLGVVVRPLVSGPAPGAVVRPLSLALEAYSPRANRIQRTALRTGIPLRCGRS